MLLDQPWLGMIKTLGVHVGQGTGPGGWMLVRSMRSTTWRHCVSSREARTAGRVGRPGRADSNLWRRLSGRGGVTEPVPNNDDGRRERRSVHGVTVCARASRAVAATDMKVYFWWSIKRAPTKRMNDAPFPEGMALTATRTVPSQRPRLEQSPR
jgi:hypothetical protein